MKFLKQFALLFFVAISLNAHASNHNLTSQTLGAAVGLFNLEYSYRFSENCTLGITTTQGHGKLGSFEVLGSSHGLVLRRYLRPALEDDSWYFIATAEKRNFEFKVLENQKEYRAESQEWVAAAGAGYQWFWQSFNIGFGLLLNNQKKVELKTSTDETFRTPLNSGLGIDFTIGGKF